MKIQLISNGDRKAINDPNITINPLSSPQSLDEFEVNIIDLSTPSLWRASAYNKNKAIDSINDFRSIQQMVDRKRKAYVFYVLPVNEIFYFYRPEHMIGINEYQQPLKDCLRLVSYNISQILPSSRNDGSPTLIYEKTITKINEKDYEASFYFENFFYYGWSDIASSIAGKDTIIAFNKVCLTTLQILESQEKLTNFINYFFPPKEDEPEWAKDIHVLNDEELEQTIESKKQEIALLEEEIEVANSKKRENARIKSILYTNGDQLVEVVFEILEKLLSCDLSTFEDKKNLSFEQKSIKLIF